MSTFASNLRRVSRRALRRDRYPGRATGTGPAFDEHLSLERIVRHENLLRAFNELKQWGGQAPGIDGIRLDDLSTAEAGQVFRQVERSILERHYVPHPTRTVSFPKPDGGTRQLRLATATDRTVAKAAYEGLADRIDAQLPEHAFVVNDPTVGGQSVSDAHVVEGSPDVVGGQHK